VDKLNSCCKDTRIQLFQLIWLGVGDIWLVEVVIVKLGFGNMILFSGRKRSEECGGEWASVLDDD